MGQSSSITMPSMAVIVGRVPAVDEKLLCFLFVRKRCEAVLFSKQLWCHCMQKCL